MQSKPAQLHPQTNLSQLPHRNTNMARASPWKAVNTPLPPPSATELSHGFTIHAPSSSDLWETPATAPVFTCPMIYQSIPLGSFRRSRVTITADLKDRYAQGGLALIIHRPDAARAWVKAGVEFMDGEQLVCVVGRDRLPDASLGTLITTSSGSGSDADAAEAEVTIEMVREDTGLAVFEILAGDGSGHGKRKVIREMAWVFSASGDEECWIGAYAAKPAGDAKDPDIAVRFRGLVVEVLDT
ncbi:uncharacterized protein APUU_21598A [Aspergillus puulaauensis]|uniref:Uncharacterized protein n=1 Tax=Aspergillus puulaauensis TaxID=1220207 RepID=A0A7R7XGU4_9EURO|nr:uncharacterized protein APUU_21598A [Aspergillus puulaauensis]BCS21166.1 hypothetical protein APUU_21598A [Aspergillus puulaauensis]